MRDRFATRHPRIAAALKRMSGSQAATLSGLPRWWVPGLLGLATLSASAAVPRVTGSTPPVVPSPVAQDVDPGAVDEAVDEAAARRLLGLWDLQQADAPADQIRFYYFHEGGIGLYRYGRSGLTFTHSYDWRIRDGVLELRFRKTGASHLLAYALRADDSLLILPHDPREGGAATYRRAPEGGPTLHSLAPWLDGVGGHPMGAADASSPTGQMWIEYQPFATGGAGFAIYQFAPAALDGRGVGWHHRGDFDDWSTEAFHYQLRGDQLTLRFDRFGDDATTRFAIGREHDEEAHPGGDSHPGMADGVRGAGAAVLELRADPRNGWHRSRLRHLGRSFAF